MKTVVIIGGGFAGSLIAKELSRHFSVIMIDDKNYFEFTPGVLRIVVDIEHISKIQRKHERYLKHANIIKDCVISIDEHQVHLKHKKSVSYDYLVIASGSRYELPIKANGLVQANRVEKLKKAHDDAEHADTIILIGGGLVGVELTGELLDMYRNKKIIVIHAAKELIPRNHPKSRAYAKRYLERRGVELVFEEFVKEVKNGVCRTKSGKSFKGDVIFLCTGIKPNSDFVPKRMRTERGFVEVNDFLQVKGAKNIFAPGDVNAIREEKTAQAAEQGAKIVAHNICALENKSTLKPYKQKKNPMVISLGKYNAIVEYKNFVYRGKIPAVMKWGIERWEMLKKR